MANEDVIEGEVVVSDMAALAVLAKAEIDANVATAKQYPRSLKQFKSEALDLVTLDEKVSEACIFAVPRGKENVNGKWVQKFIEGPSIRFAEMIVSAYGNCRSGAKVIGEEKDYVIAEGFFHDLEKNVAVKVEVKRRITDSKGKRYNADMIAMTGNAACSVARRNAALQCIPQAIWTGLYNEAKKVAIGDASTLVKKRSEMMLYFQKMNVTSETILEFLGVQGLEDIGLDELAIIKGIATAIKEGTVTVDKAFVVEDTNSGRSGKDAAALDRINKAKEEAEKSKAVITCEFCQPENGQHQSACPNVEV